MRIPNGTHIIADTTGGTIHIDPDAALITLYEQIAKKKQAPVPKDLPEHSYTTDGRNVQVYVNVNILHDAQAGFDRKAEGIGLYRSEFPFLIQNDFPSEEQQLQVYEKVCETAGDRVITLRTSISGETSCRGMWKRSQRRTRSSVSEVSAIPWKLPISSSNRFAPCSEPVQAKDFDCSFRWYHPRGVPSCQAGGLQLYAAARRRGT